MELNKIEILSVDLLTQYPAQVESFCGLTDKLGKGLGWHYLLDLTWAAQELKPEPGMRVLDAGAGTGVMQWWLAGNQVDVISADRLERKSIPLHFRQNYRVRGLRKSDLDSIVSIKDFLPSPRPKQWSTYPAKLSKSLKMLGASLGYGAKTGVVYIYNQDLANLVDIPDNSLDGVVSISALEHNSPADLRTCVKELMRVLKPGKKLVATLGAAPEKDWFHDPSKGWCYTEKTLQESFGLSSGYSSNYGSYYELLKSLRENSYLRDHLADFYYKSGDNGMPWGKWNPVYQPVGVVKIKN